jgi:hypothetical protein
MATDLTKLKKTKVTTPPLIAIYGAPGIGKTSFGIGANSESKYTNGNDKHVLMNVDFRGGDRLNCTRLFNKQIKSLQEIKEGFKSLATQEHDFKWLAIDDLTTLEEIFTEEVCKENNVDAIGKVEYGRGYELAKTKWVNFFDNILELQKIKKIGVVLIAHTKVDNHKDPMTESYSRHDLQLDKRSKEIVKKSIELIGFAHKKVITKQKDLGFGNKEYVAIGESQRVLTIAPDLEGFESKDRFNLPSEIPLDFSVFEKYLVESLKK